MHRRATSAFALAGVIAGLGVGAGAAHAGSSNVVSTITAQDRILSRSPALRQLSHSNLTNVAQARAAIPKFAALNAELKSAATAVSKASTSSPAQKRGQTDWVDAVRDLSKGVTDVEAGLKDVVAHKAAGGRAAIRRAGKPLQKATALDQKADALLGVSG